jgi:hypothetical protein
MKNKFLILVKWGVLGAIALFGLELVKYAARVIDYSFQYISLLMWLLVIIFLLYLAIKEIKEQQPGGVISFGRAFLVGVAVVAITTIFLIPLMVVDYRFIDKEAVSEMNKKNRTGYIEFIQRDTLSTSEKVAFHEAIVLETKNITDSLLQNEPDTFKNQASSEINRLLAVMEVKLRGKDSLYLSNFIKIAQTEWLASSSQLMNQLVYRGDTTVAWQKIGLITQVVKGKIPQYNPLDSRIAANEAKIPFYKSNEQAAVFYSFSIFLYGIFLNIFVSLYLYRRKPKGEEEGN